MPFIDDELIQADDKLLRRIHPKHVVPDKEGGFRPSSAAFNDRELSVDIESKMNEVGKTHNSCLDGYNGYGLAWFSAGTARANDQAVCLDPLPDNATHGIVFGDKPNKVKKQLVHGSTWLVEIRPPES